MRASIRIARPFSFAALLACALLACGGNSEREGIEAAKREAEAEQKARGAAAPARKVATPVRGDVRIPCTQLIDAAAFQTALGEKAELIVRDVTTSDADATSSCALVRGGKRPSEAEQKTLLKRVGRLGVLPGDELCNVTAYCKFIDDPDRFRAACKQRKEQDDESMGSYACVRVVATGADDVNVYRFLDDDTRCVFQVRGGPSNVDNDLIRGCAKAARDTIGLAQIRADAAPAPEEVTIDGTGSGG